MTDQDGIATNYAYDTLGRVKRLTDADENLIVEYTYNARGELARETRGNHTFTTYEYDSAGQLISLFHQAPDGSVNSQFAYAYDHQGRQTMMTTLDGQWSYEYDAVGQLKRAEFVSTNAEIPGQVLQYDYDAAGNRIRVVRNGATTPYAVNGLNQYVSVAAAVYSYDEDGNLISIADGSEITTYAWDDEGRLIGVMTPDGDTWSYEYDVLGHRVASVHNEDRTEYLIDPTGLGDVLGEYDSGGNLIAAYAHGLGLESRVEASGQAVWYDFDGTGSTVGLSGDAGEYINEYRYLPYGDLLVPATELVENPFQFVGQFGVMAEENGLQFMRARFYSPDDGRFISEDPVGHTGGVNLYGYVANQPTGFVDPSGLAPVPKIGDLLEGGSMIIEYIQRDGGIVATDKTLVDVSPLAEHTTDIGPNAIENRGRVTARRNAVRLSGRGAARGFIHPSMLRALGRAFAVVEAFQFGWDVGRALDRQFGLGEPVMTYWGDLFCDLLDCEDGADVGQSVTQVVGAFDPNDIIGPAGFGDDGFLTGDFPLPYTIRFENLAAAARRPGKSWLLSNWTRTWTGPRSSRAILGSAIWWSMSRRADTSTARAWMPLIRWACWLISRRS